MNVEIECTTGRVYELVVSATLGSESEAFLGKKKCTGVGSFQYEWVVEYLTKDELMEMSKVFAKVADMMEGE